MTVKLAKFFSNSSSNNSVAHTPSPPLPPPNHTAEANQYYNSMGYQQTHYNPYMDDDDNLSMYSTSTSIMTARDHPYNNSQRPLLADRKPQLLNKKKLQPQIQSKNNNNHHQHHHQYQYHKQQAMQHLQHQQQQNYHHQDNCKPYISPYVQQQKRDSAKGLHGFNDFDILSQQYNQHLQSPHIGYPYGSPPSPTTTVNASDFTFDPLPSNPPPPLISSSSSNSSSSSASHIATTKLTSTPSPQTARYANIKGINTSYPTVSTKILSPLYSHNDYNNYESCNNHTPKNPSNEYFIGKSSRFEDDFCTRRNIEFSKPSLDHDTNSYNDTSSTSKHGPFVFDPIHAQQYTTAPHGFNSHLAKNGRGFYDSIDNVDATPVINPETHYNPVEKVKYSLPSGQTTMQSTSDTSSSSRDSKATKGLKSLLKRRKSDKKNKKEIKENNNGNCEEDTKTTEKTTKPTIKCVVVGDGAVGKTNLILSYLENRFNTEHVPTASDIYNADVMVNDSPVHLTLCDTAGQDTLDPLRELCYPDSDVFLLCFSVTKPETFHAIKSKWAPKFAKTKAALILVGTQSDLRTNTNVLNKLQTTGEKPISYADAWDLATTIGAKYIETSSATQDKVKEVFDTAIWEGLLPTTLPPTPSFWRKLFCLA